MQIKRVKIDAKVLSLVPSANVSVIVVKGLDNKGSNPDIKKLVDGVQRIVAVDMADYKSHPVIQSWKNIYSSFGSKHNSSVEALVKRVVNGEGVKEVNKLVDLHNFLSLKHVIPVGVYDLDKVDGNVELAVSNGNEKFVPLGSSDVEHPLVGEVIYRDDMKVLCRRWNNKDSNSTKVDEDTKNAIVFIDSVNHSRDEIEMISEEAVSLIKEHIGGDAYYYILDIVNNEMRV